MDLVTTTVTRKPNAAFPLKLHEILSQIENDGLGDIVGWMPHGRSFKIHKQKEFADIVLPKYFVMTKKSSFEKLQKWVDELKERGPDGIVLCVAANKCDLEEGREVEVAEGAEFAQKSGADFFETSAKNDENVGRIFTTLVTNVQRKSEAARPAGEARLDAAPPKRTSCCG